MDTNMKMLQLIVCIFGMVRLFFNLMRQTMEIGL